VVKKGMHLLEEPTDTREVYKRDDWLAEVHYSLVVTQEVIVTGPRLVLSSYLPENHPWTDRDPQRRAGPDREPRGPYMLQLSARRL
jgi:hypothetical protein